MPQPLHTTITRAQGVIYPRSPEQKFVIDSEAEANALRTDSQKNPMEFWDQLAQGLSWRKNYEKVFRDADLTGVRQWFPQGSLNLVDNCVRRHVNEPAARQSVALIWEGEPQVEESEGEQRWLTYAQLKEQIEKVAHAMRISGVCPGDRVALAFPQVPELLISFLACADIGAIAVLLPGAGRGEALKEWKEIIAQSSPAMMLCATGGHYGGFFHGIYDPLKMILREGDFETVQCVVLRRHEDDVQSLRTQDVDWERWLADTAQTISVDPDSMTVGAQHPLFISWEKSFDSNGSSPLGLCHSTAGFLCWAQWTTQWLYDLNEMDTFWSLADPSSVSFLSHACGCLALGGKLFLYEGGVMAPQAYRAFEMVDRHHASVILAPNSLWSSWMKLNAKDLRMYDLTSLRILASCGGFLHPETWKILFHTVGATAARFVDVRHEALLGGAVMGQLPGLDNVLPGAAGRELPGVKVYWSDVATHPEAEELVEGRLLIDAKHPAAVLGQWSSEQSAVVPLHDTLELRHCRIFQDHEGVYWVSDSEIIPDIHAHDIELALLTHPRVREAVVSPDGVIRDRDISPYSLTWEGMHVSVTTSEPLSQDAVTIFLEELRVAVAHALDRPADRLGMMRAIEIRPFMTHKEHRQSSY